MGKAPAVIIIARHGARLDAEDSEWVLNSPAPYDPPLTYGGWTQTRALGARIASLLHAREVSLGDEDVTREKRGSGSDGEQSSAAGLQSRSKSSIRRKKHKIVIHSSPFLRCVQSSIAVSAGIAQYKGNLAKFERQQAQLPQSGHPAGGIPRSQTLDSRDFDAKYERKPTAEAQEAAAKAKSQMRYRLSKITLRIDACLGEWLTPDYFEHITPPPSSSKMISTAKVGLLRPQTPIHSARMPGDPSFDSLKKVGTAEDKNTGGFSTSELVESLSQEEPSRPSLGKRTSSRSKTAELENYTAPTPLYHMTPSDPIPRGFVAHARNVCVKIDSMWDSIKDPQNWGDGGEYGEEWRSMHRRFRRAIVNMVAWYKDHGVNDAGSDDSTKNTLEAGDDEDLVLVILTHGAGANALIGAMTSQPVLMDVGLASLTMAVRKSTAAQQNDLQAKNSNGLSPIGRRRSSMDNSLAEEYEMKLIASTDHLRAGSDPLKIPQLQSPKLMPSIPEYSQSGSSASSGVATPVEVGGQRSRNAALGSARRPRSSTAWPSTYNASPLGGSPAASGGLWGSRASSYDPSDGVNLVGARHRSLDGMQSPGEAADRGDTIRSAPPARSGSGLWGSDSPLDSPGRGSLTPT